MDNKEVKVEVAEFYNMSMFYCHCNCNCGCYKMDCKCTHSDPDEEICDCTNK